MIILHVLLHALWLLTATATSPVPPGCQGQCGKVSITYPFGIGSPDCYKDEEFEIICNDSFSPWKPFLATISAEVLEISPTTGLVYIASPIASACLSFEPGQPSSYSNYTTWLHLDENGPYTYSSTHNSLTAIGCGTTAFIGTSDASYTSGCLSLCGPNMSVINGSCTGIGCCQASIPEGEKSFVIGATNLYNSTFWSSADTCSYAFLVDHERFSFYTSDLSGHNFMNRSSGSLPLALEWAVGNETCAEARNKSSFMCSRNSYCYNSENGAGYLCECFDGFVGNPYLHDGCQDFDECEDPNTNPCISLSACKNSVGSYCCQCPLGTTGDGRKNGTGCTSLLLAATSENNVLKVALGCGSGFLLLILGGSWFYWGLRKRKIIKLREKFFQQNGGLLLQQQLSSCEGANESARIFTSEELKRATDNYHESRILGKGGHGTVYKGILPDHRIVAIKKSKVVDESQIEQFINEVVILSQINHKNVVKLLGCCLETEVPLLVYEFVTNGTLFEHIHDNEGCPTASISWLDRLRIAAETAGSLAYLHSAASVPIIHRDVKSMNILLDYYYTAKVSDFGASRLVPLGHAQFTTLVQGTLGYLDPEYFHTSQLSEKSDVYSFGVVLAELLTGELPLSLDRSEKELNLAMYFVTHMGNNRLVDILEQRVAHEGRIEQVEAVAELAKRCLKLRGEERPTMKEVAMELEGMMRLENHPLAVEDVQKESECLLGEVPGFDTGNSSVFDSLVNHMLFSLDTR